MKSDDGQKRVGRKHPTLEQMVYGMLARVPKGRVTTYLELSRAVGLKNGQRAIGRIMNKNPYPGIIPCHRVVMSTGKIGGYAYGKAVKENMLAVEGVSVANDKIADLARVMYRFDSEGTDTASCGHNQ